MQLLWSRVFGQEKELETRLEGLGQNDINLMTVARLSFQGARQNNLLHKE